MGNISNFIFSENLLELPEQLKSAIQKNKEYSIQQAEKLKSQLHQNKGLLQAYVSISDDLKHIHFSVLHTQPDSE